MQHHNVSTLHAHRLAIVSTRTGSTQYNARADCSLELFLASRYVHSFGIDLRRAKWMSHNGYPGVAVRILIIPAYLTLFYMTVIYLYVLKKDICFVKKERDREEGEGIPNFKIKYTSDRKII